MPGREEDLSETDRLERDGVSFSSSSAKLRSLGAWCCDFLGLAPDRKDGFDWGFAEMAVEGASPPVESSSLSSSPTRRRKFLALLLLMLVPATSTACGVGFPIETGRGGSVEWTMADEEFWNLEDNQGGFSDRAPIKIYPGPLPMLWAFSERGVLPCSDSFAS